MHPTRQGVDAGSTPAPGLSMPLPSTLSGFVARLGTVCANVRVQHEDRRIAKSMPKVR